MSNEPCDSESTTLIAKKDTDGDVEDGTTASAEATESGATVLDDAIDILQLAIPIFITSFSWVGVSNVTEQLQTE